MSEEILIKCFENSKFSPMLCADIDQNKLFVTEKCNILDEFEFDLDIKFYSMLNDFLLGVFSGKKSKKIEINDFNLTYFQGSLCVKRKTEKTILKIDNGIHFLLDDLSIIMMIIAQKYNTVDHVIGAKTILNVIEGTPNFELSFNDKKMIFMHESQPIDCLENTTNSFKIASLKNSKIYNADVKITREGLTEAIEYFKDIKNYTAEFGNLVLDLHQNGNVDIKYQKKDIDGNFCVYNSLISRNYIHWLINIIDVMNNIGVDVLKYNNMINITVR